MPINPVRRSHLIAPFGVGALSVGKDGATYITAALDYWFNEEVATDKGSEIDLHEYKVEEWRLQRLLGVDHFRLPPDYRAPGNYSHEKVNMSITIPVYRFPRWHVCPACGRLEQMPLTLKAKPKCRSCQRTYMSQVQLITMCENGHLHDFPWREWVHQDEDTQCQAQLSLSKSGASTLQYQIVSCNCGAKRSLANVMWFSTDGSSTGLSTNLNRSPKEYLCSGSSPWFGRHQPEGACGLPVRAALTNATNVYYPDTKSAIYLPRRSDIAPSELVELMETSPLDDLIRDSSKSDAQRLRLHHPLILKPFTDEQIEAALKIVSNKNRKMESAVDQIVDYENFEGDLLPLEYEQLKCKQDEPQLQVQLIAIESIDEKLRSYFSTISLVKKLRETRALVGFSRVYPGSSLSLEQKKKMMFNEAPTKGESWLPAIIVHGEGIFLEFDQDKLESWESYQAIEKRVKKLVERHKVMERTRKWLHKSLSARFLMIHTFAHILINELTFECGYSAASLRERLYVSNLGGKRLSGVLIYTASGDSEGTLGGLVAMGRPGYLEPIIWKALEKAKWCSADPVCMEIGSGGGQGPESCNLAACHNCCLVPETSCQEGNRFLDRALLIGDPVSGADIGFFK
ncbi:MAG: DrmB family protein [Desulfomonilaceae bacterium]